MQISVSCFVTFAFIPVQPLEQRRDHIEILQSLKIFTFDRWLAFRGYGFIAVFGLVKIGAVTVRFGDRLASFWQLVAFI